MNTIRSIASMNSYRIPPRLRLVATRLGSLILLFQRMPVVQFLFPEANIIGGASVANTVSLAVTTVVGLGVFDSVSGQSQINEKAPLNVIGKTPAGTSPTAPNAINVPATVSAPLTFSFNWDPNNSYSSVKSWRCTTGGNVGTLPAGLGPALDPLPNPAVGVGGLITISGTPTVLPGIYPVTINVYRSSNYTNTTAAQIFNICVLGFSPQPAATTTISSGQSANLTCTATGFPIATTFHTATPTVTYQWYLGSSGAGSAISGASGTLTQASPTASYTTPNNLSGTTNYWVKVTSVLSGNTVAANSTTATVNVTPSVSLVVAPASVTEDGAGNLVYTFTRTGATTAALTVNFSVAGTAVFSSDYTQTGAAGFSASTGSVTIPIGASSAAVTVNPSADTTVEPDETAILTVVAAAGYTAGAPSVATGTIMNDDTAYSSWASAIAGGQNGPLQTPQNDGVTNLQKFAFNMNPTAPDVGQLTVGAGGNSGLPGGAVVGGKLRIEYLRRKASSNPGITYMPQFTSTLGGWVDFSGTETVGTAPDPFERITVEDTIGGPARFGRVKVVKSP